MKAIAAIFVSTLIMAVPGAFAGPVYSWSGTGSGTAAYYTASTGASICGYGSGSLYGGTTSCVVANNGTMPLTYNTGAGLDPYPFAGDQSSLTINVSSDADTAGLHAYAYVQATGDPYIPGFTGSFYDTNHGGGGTGTATAEQADTWTPVPPAGWAGGPFYMVFDFDVDGEFSGTVSPGASTNSYAEGNLDFYITGGTGGNAYVGGNYNQDFSLPTNIEQGVGNDTVDTSISTTPMEITSLNPISYVFSLEAIAFASCTTNPNQGLCSVTSTAQLSNTASLVGIEFEDANGNPIPGFTLLDSDGGTEYDALITSNDSSAAPEPGTVWLLVAGVGSVALIRGFYFISLR